MKRFHCREKRNRAIGLSKEFLLPRFNIRGVRKRGNVNVPREEIDRETRERDSSFHGEGNKSEGKIK